MASASRVARKPVTIPAGVEVKVEGQELKIKGPKGTNTVALHRFVEVVIEDGLIKVNENPNAGYCRGGSGSKLRKSIPGTTKANIANAVRGVTELFEEKLSLVGVGYKAQAKGKVVSLSLGFSHPVDYQLSEGVPAETPSPQEIILKSTSIETLGRDAAKIRDYRKPEPYKGKGVRYANENVVRKETKKK